MKQRDEFALNTLEVVHAIATRKWVAIMPSTEQVWWTCPKCVKDRADNFVQGAQCRGSYAAVAVSSRPHRSGFPTHVSVDPRPADCVRADPSCWLCNRTGCVRADPSCWLCNRTPKPTKAKISPQQPQGRTDAP